MSEYSKTLEYFIETVKENKKMPSMHYHSSYELYYLEAGKRDYFVGDKYFRVPTGSFVLIPPYKFHRTGGEYVSRTLVGFTKEFMLKTFTESALDNILKCFDVFLITPPDEEQESFKNLLKLLAHSQNSTDFSLYLGILLTELCRSKPETVYDESTSRIIRYINENFAEIHSIEQIANRFYISKFHLCRIFKNTIGLTVIDYLNNIKIKNACKYISYTDKDLNEISKLCGFNSSAYFSKVFKEIMGISPREYRKKR